MLCLGTIEMKDGMICLKSLTRPLWYPLAGNSHIAMRFQETFNRAQPSDIGRRLFTHQGVLQMESLEQMRTRQARELSK